MKAIRFELRGKFAHFRKFYTNSSSLTYPIPPPPTISGILGGALGIPRDKYPKLFENTSFSVRPTSPWRTIVQTINLLMVRDSSELSGSAAHTQIPTYILVPPKLNGELIFEILVTHPDEHFLDRIYTGIQNPIFPPCLGTAYCLGRITGIEQWEGQYLDTFKGEIYGAIRASNLKESINISEGQRVLRDRFPLKLSVNRSLLVADDLLIETQGKPLQTEVHNVLMINGRGYALL